MRCLRHILLLIIALVSLSALGQDVPADTAAVADTTVHLNKFQQFKERIRDRVEKKMNEPYDTIRDGGYWWRAMKHGVVDLTGKTINYPKFLRFAWKTYKWGDKAFNSYDSAYVVGTGKNWKLMLKSMNWADTYSGEPVPNSHIFVRSNLTSNIGLQLSFMAVSVGFTMGVTDLIHGKGKSKKVDFSFTCARFAAEAYYMENVGATTMDYRHNADDEKYKGTIRNFNGLKRKSYGMDAYYFFNNRRYAQAAAYCFSKYQKRSAGSLIAGFNLQHRDLQFNTEEFPQVVQDQLPEGVEMPRFLYNDYCLMVGYGYNWVISKSWLFNITMAPYVGYRHVLATQLENRISTVSINMRARMGAVYNHKQYFVGIQSYADIHRYHTDHYYFVGSILDFTALVGIRF
ncbi:MAG: DUF4421 domain-containing protein [Muribaculaceae bacterium]|nr:DUF4421 domain-containing protein [Muribaculaceae bacterium]